MARTVSRNTAPRARLLGPPRFREIRPSGPSAWKACRAPHLAARRCRSEPFGSGFLQRLDMAAQRRIGSQPQQPIDPVFSAPVEDFRAGVVRIGAQQNLDPRPEGADGANETAQEGADLVAAWPLARAQQRGDETPLAIKHDDRLEAVIVMKGVEQA